MHKASKISLWLVLAVFLCSATVAHADEKDKDKKKKTQASATTAASEATFPDVGNCNLGSATKDLDGNNIRARLYNNGHLFWKGSGNVYTVPKNGEANAIFASGIWIGGLDPGGNLRFAGTDYGPFEYWPGPLDNNGNPPANCTSYDRIYKITQDDLTQYEQTGTATADVQEWPWELGAPVVDGDGNPNNYNLEGGDRPQLIGAQTAWWVMNDVGNSKGYSRTPPIGLEVQVTAFAFNTSDALNNTTFYRYKLIHKGDVPLRNTYFGIWSDPDLGNATDDFVGSDTTLGMGFVYNGTPEDPGVDGYGNLPPALGYDFFQGPLVNNDGRDNDGDGEVDEEDERIQMTQFVYYNNDSSNQGNPDGETDDPYNYLRGRWRDGTRMTVGGTGLGGTVPTDFMFPGDPVAREYWSEENTDGAGSRNTPADRRFLMSSGPFTMQPGDVQEIVYGIVWSQSVNRLASVAQLRFDDVLAQGAFNSNFQIPPPPNAPDVSVDVLDQAVVLEWSNPPSANNYLNSYDFKSAFLLDQNPADNDTTYTFEGYRIFQYDSPFAQEGRAIATYDVANNVTTILDEQLDIESGAVVTQVVANGADTGVQNYAVIDNLINYQEYYFGVQAYAYNPNSLPKVYASPIVRVTATPGRVEARNGGTASIPDPETIIASELAAGLGDPPGVFAQVSNPGAVTGATYEVRIMDLVESVGENIVIGEDTVRALIIDGDTLETALGYDIVNTATGQTVVSALDYYNRTGEVTPLGQNVISIDGLSFSIDTAPPSYKEFSVIANASGPLDPPDMGTFAFNANGFPFLDGDPANDRPSDAQQVGEGHWGIATGDDGTRSGFEAFLDRTSNGNFATRRIVPYDFEIRFTEEGSLGYDAFCTGAVYQVPFELWRIGINTPDDPSDDVRMVPYMLDNDYTSITEFGGLPPFNLNTAASIQASIDALGEDSAPCGTAEADHSVSGGTDDPQTDWFYWATPTDETPGDAGYQAWAAAAASVTPEDDFYGVLATDDAIRRMVLVNWNGGDVTTGEYNQDMPETGTIFRIVTTKPLVAGDVFTINTADFAPVRNDAETARNVLDQIGITPNPYKGASAYEVNVTNDVARFTNMPNQATIRVFTLGGTLIRTLFKNSDSPSFPWDLKTEEGLPLASGMYLIHVDVPDVGEKVIKFGFIKKRIQLDLL